MQLVFLFGARQRQAATGYERASCFLGLSVRGLTAWMDAWMEDVTVYEAPGMAQDAPWLHE